MATTRSRRGLEHGGSLIPWTMPHGERPLIRSGASPWLATQKRIKAENAAALKILADRAGAMERAEKRSRESVSRKANITPQRRDKAPKRPSVFAVPKRES